MAGRMRKKQRDKMFIYLDIDGVVLGKNEHGRIALIPNFRSLLRYLRKNYECRWLTTHGRYNADDAIEYLKPFLKGITAKELRFIKAVPWRTLKTEAIDFNSLFIWVDDQPLQFELDILREKGFLDRWLKVDTYKDYRELTIARIEAKRREIFAALAGRNDEYDREWRRR
jgi:hypothetical protein